MKEILNIYEIKYINKETSILLKYNINLLIYHL